MSQVGAHEPGHETLEPTKQVGYGRPPVEHRFKPGKSGNPKGRPKKSVSNAAYQSDWGKQVSKAANRRIRVTENGQIRSLTVKQGILQVMANKALKGDVQASRLLLDHIRSVEQGEYRERRRRFERQIAYKERFEAEIRRCDATLLEPPDPVPHPADMIVDSVREVVIVNGPADDVEKAEWAAREAEKAQLVAALTQVKADLDGPNSGLKRYGGSRTVARDLLHVTERRLAYIETAYPSEKRRRKTDFIEQQVGVRRRSLKSRMVELESQCQLANAAAEALMRQQDAHHDAAGIAALTDTKSKVRTQDSEQTLAFKQVLKARIAYLEDQLTRIEDALDPEFEDHKSIASCLDDLRNEILALSET